MNIPKIKREQRLRRAILELADASRAADEIHGRMIADAIGILPDFLEAIRDAAENYALIRHDDMLLQLLSDLVHLKLLTERDARTLTKQRRSLDLLYFAITPKGTGLLNGVEPKEPLVDDERI